MKRVKPSIQALSVYSVLQDKSVVKLNQNESPYDLSGNLKRLVIERLKKDDWNRYPPSVDTRFLNALAAYTGHPSGGIVIGNGSNEIIQAIFSAVCNAGDKVLLVSPGFSIFIRLAQIMDLEILDVPLQDDFEFNVEAIIAKAPKAQLIVLAIPHNPTGKVLDPDVLETIVKNASGIVVIDEAYYEFYKVSAQKLLAIYDNLIITRTFSKAFGLAGIRLGYLLARPGLAREIEKAKLPFSVGVFQQFVGEVVLNHRAMLESIVEKIINERARVYAELKAMPYISPIPSAANFILFQIERRSASIAFDALYERGILVRHFSEGRIKDMLRVTIGKRNENTKFIAGLGEFIGTKKGVI